jgi:hypothetical protein
MANTVFDVLIKKLNEHKSSATEFLADGGCKDYAHYRNLCGVIQGLSLAQREVSDLARNYLEDEDD